MDAQKMYGVWIPGQGWLKVNGEPVAFQLRDVALATSKRIRNYARVEFIDNALADLEPYFLSLEKQREHRTWYRRLYNAVFTRTAQSTAR